MALAASLAYSAVPLDRQISEIDSELPVALAKYLEQDHASTTAMMSSMVERLNVLRQRAVDLKDEALRVYRSE